MKDNVKPKLELISLFSTPVVKTNINRSFTKKEIDCIKSIPMTQRVDYTLKQGSQSQFFDVFDNVKTKEGLKDIKTFCEHELKRYLEEIEGVDTDITTLQITQSWFTKLNPQELHGLHNHRNSYLSGVLYFRCLPNDFIQFTNRNFLFDQSLELPKKKTTKFTAKIAKVNIKEGDFIIFSSYIPHEVVLNETKDKQRISLGFDTWPTYLPSLYPPYK